MRGTIPAVLFFISLGAACGAESQAPGYDPRFAVGWDPMNSQLLFDAKLGKSIWGGFALGGQWDAREDAEDDFDILATMSVRIALMRFQTLVLNLKLAGMVDDIGKEDERDSFDSANAGDLRMRMLIGGEPEWILGRFSMGFAFGALFAAYPDFRVSQSGPASISGLITLRFLF